MGFQLKYTDTIMNLFSRKQREATLSGYTLLEAKRVKKKVQEGEGGKENAWIAMRRARRN